jgi:hypothetical protein
VAREGLGELADVDALQRLGAAGGGAERTVVDGGREVEEGARGRGDCHAVVAGRVVEVEAGGAVDAQAWVGMRRGAEHRDLGMALLPRHEAPQRRR